MAFSRMRYLAAGAILFLASPLSRGLPVLDLLWATHWPREEALAPDGGRVAWVEAVNAADRTPTNQRIIYLLAPGKSLPVRLTAGTGRGVYEERGLAWSPDGRRLALLSDAATPKQVQLYVAAVAGGAPRRLTKLAGQVNRPRWSPDGRTIALLYVEGQAAKVGAIEAAPKPSGEVREEVLEQRIVLVDAATGATRFVSPPDQYVYEFAWSPDGRRLAYVAAPGSGDNNWWIARLYAGDAATGAATELYRPQTQIAVPRWSPDGRSVAFIQGLMSDQGQTGGDIWLVAGDGSGGARNLTPGRPATPSWISWLPGGDLLFTERRDGGVGIGRLDPKTGQARDLWQGDESLGGQDDERNALSLSADGRTCAVIRSSFGTPPEVWTGAIGSWTQRSQRNRGQEPLWGKSERVVWQSDGHRVQGWLIYPKRFDPAKRYPLVLVVHGGPASQFTPSWPLPWFDLTVLAAGDCFVFAPNPRGSYGQGEAFTAGNVKDFGYGDLRDDLAGLDAVLARVPVDPQRLGIGGWSYGGYLTMWAGTQTQRFRAAVAGAGIANWQSYYGQNDIDQWMIPYFGASVYADPAIYARSSPITFIRAVKTPTLIVGGDADKECPVPQAFEYWHALHDLGVPTKLVVYPGEGHHFHDPAHIQDLFERTIGWFDHYLR